MLSYLCRNSTPTIGMMETRKRIMWSSINRWMNPSCDASRSNRSTFFDRSFTTAATASGMVFSWTCQSFRLPSVRNQNSVRFPSLAMMCTSLAPGAHGLHQSALHQIHQGALADFGFERVLIEGVLVVFLLHLDADFGVLQQLQKFILRRDHLLEQVLQIFQAAVGHFVLLRAEFARDQRNAPVRRVRSDNDQLVRLFLIVPEREHPRLDHHVADVLGKAIHIFLDELDTTAVHRLVGKVDLTECVQIRDFTEDRVVIGAKIIHQNLSEVPAVLLVLPILDLQGLLEGLVVDDPLLEEREADFIRDVDGRHGFGRLRE